MIESDAIARQPGEPLGRLVLFARLGVAGFSLVPVVLGILLLVLGMTPSTANVAANAFMLSIFAVMSALAMAMAPIVYVMVARLAREPLVYAVTSVVCFGVAVAGALIAFVASILVESLLPFAVGAIALTGVAALVWPRRRQWERWAARRSRQEPPHAEPPPVTG